MAQSAQSALKGVAEMNLRLGLAVAKRRELEQKSGRLCMGWWCQWWLVLVILVIAVIAVDPHC
jgi:hypothetical protein